MANETVEKISSDEVVVKESVIKEEFIDVEEVTAKKAGYQAQKEATIAQYDSAIAECDALLAKAAQAGVVADGVEGEPTPEVPAEPVIEPVE